MKITLIMKVTLIVIVLYALCGWAQTVSSGPTAEQKRQPPANSDADQSAMPHQQMQDMRTLQIAAMKTDIDTLKASLASLEASIPLISGLNERNRWQQNITMWRVVVKYMEAMANHKESMQGSHGDMVCGMHDHDMHHQDATDMQAAPHRHE